MKTQKMEVTYYKM